MNNRFFKLPEDATPQTKNVFRYAAIIMWATIFVLPMEVYLAIKLGGWQLWAGSFVILIVFTASHISQRMLRLGKTEPAAIVLIYSALLGIAANPLFVADVGIGLGVAGIMLTIDIASRATRRPEIHVIVGFVMGAITILLDLLLPSQRVSVPLLKVFVPIVSGALVLVLTYMTLRGFQDYNLRTKMIIAIVTIVMISVSAVAFLSYRSLASNLTENIGNNLSATANSVATGIAQVFDREASLLKMLALNDTIQSTAINVSLYNQVLSQAKIESLDSQWRTADANKDDADPLVISVLYNQMSSVLNQFKEENPQNIEVFLTDKQGVLLASTNRTSDYYQADEEWWQVASKEGVYIGQPEYDESSKTTAIIIAVAIRAQRSGNALGVLRTTVVLDSLAQALSAGLLGKTGQAVVYLPNGQELALEPGEGGLRTMIVRKSGFDANTLNQSKNKYFQTDYNQTPVLAAQFSVAQLSEGASGAGIVLDEAAATKARAMANLNMRVVAFQERSEAMMPVDVQTRNTVFMALFIFIAATAGALGLAQLIAAPIIRLNDVAQQVKAGNLAVEAKVETGDETGMLAQTFNSMTAQLRDLIGTLEHRVAERTKALATSAEVSRNLSTILNERQLIVEVVEQLKTAFDYYHVHIYLLEEASGDLLMAGGSGDIGASLLGSGHKVQKGKGLVGRAAQNNVPVLVSDTSKDPAWLPNPLLPETKSEAAVPIASADKVLGVLDVQHLDVNGLQQEDVDLLQSLANQIAIALLNARSYVDVQQRAEREARITSIGLKIKSTTSIEAALQATARELGRTLSANDIRIILEAPGLPQNGQKSD